MPRAVWSLFGYMHAYTLLCAQVGLLKDARKQLDPVDKMIDGAKWDAIRNIIKTSPLADVKVCLCVA